MDTMRKRRKFMLYYQSTNRGKKYCQGRRQYTLRLKGRQDIQWQNLIFKTFSSFLLPLLLASPHLFHPVPSFLLFFLTLICIVFSNEYFSEFPTAEDDSWRSWRFDASYLLWLWLTDSLTWSLSILLQPLS